MNLKRLKATYSTTKFFFLKTLSRVSIGLILGHRGHWPVCAPIEEHEHPLEGTPPPPPQKKKSLGLIRV